MYRRWIARVISKTNLNYEIISLNRFIIRALKNINKYAKVGSLEFINAGKGSSEIIKHEKLILNSKEFAEFTRKLVI